MPPSNPESALYRTLWRWHFYAGLYVIPFLLMLSLTGLLMLLYTGVLGRFGPEPQVTAQNLPQSASAQIQVAISHFKGAQLKEYITPANPEAPAWVVLKQGENTQALAIDPYTLTLLKTVDPDNTLFAWAERIHGTLLLGDVGDRLIEIAAGLGILMLVTGLYLCLAGVSEHWRERLLPTGTAGRPFWRSLHRSLGFWCGAILLLFLLSGLAWTGIWGSRIVQPWGSFPAEKWRLIPTSDLTHASLAPSTQQAVPWGLAQTPLPASGSAEGSTGPGTPLDVDRILAWASTQGFSNPLHLTPPEDESGVYTLSVDTMSGDLHNPTGDRTLHLDRYTGHVLADVRFADYPLLAKTMAVGVALHQGNLGLWNVLLNALFCLSVILLCITGTYLWWSRRPAGALIAPPSAARSQGWRWTLALGIVALCALFPLSGLAALAMLALNALVRRVKDH